MKLICLGDSWAWGSDLIDPTSSDVGIDWMATQRLTVHTSYRIKHRYITLLANRLQAELIDLTTPGCSNDTITRNLLNYLAVEGYLSGEKMVTELMISIGWTAPERRDFYYPGINNLTSDHPEYGWFTIQPSCLRSYSGLDLIDFQKFYASTLVQSEEYMYRYISQVYHTQTMLKSLGIKFFMHQAFYDENIFHQHRDKLSFNSNAGNPVEILWNQIDCSTFINKNDLESPTFKAYITIQAKKLNQRVFDKEYECYHPNAFGHQLWCDYIYQFFANKR